MSVLRVHAKPDPYQPPSIVNLAVANDPCTSPRNPRCDSPEQASSIVILCAAKDPCTSQNLPLSSEL